MMRYTPAQAQPVGFWDWLDLLISLPMLIGLMVMLMIMKMVMNLV